MRSESNRLKWRDWPRTGNECGGDSEELRKRVFLTLLLLPLLVGSVYALTTVRFTSTILQAFEGATIIDRASITIQDQGLSVLNVAVSAAGTAQGTPVVFSSSNPFVSNGVPVGDWALSVLLFTTSSTPASQTFTVTLGFVTAGPVGTPIRLYVATGATVTPGNAVAIYFDLGSTLANPFTYTLTVQ